MKFRIIRASADKDSDLDKQPVSGAVRDGDRWFVEVPTIEALMALRKEAEADLIVGPGFVGCEPDIWIYDDYME